MSTVSLILSIIITFIVSGGLFSFIFFKVGIKYRMQTAEKEIGSAEQHVKTIIETARAEAESNKKQALLDAKDEIFKMRNDAESEIKERRSDISRQEKWLVQKEETLDKKSKQIERKEQQLTDKGHQLERTRIELNNIKIKQQKMLEKISGMTAVQAKEALLGAYEKELDHEKAVRLKVNEQLIKEESQAKAREIISLSISRCAADHSSEATVSVVSLPNDDMKGRIIGREGRNIRSIEMITGVDLIIDDTPETIAVSCFDPVRREIAKQALERLIADGRIHPGKIEEAVEKSRRNVEQTIKEEGNRAVLEANVHGIPIELVKLLGRLKFRTSYGQNVLSHSIEVANLAGLMASELGADVQSAKRAGLIHDIGKALNHEIEGSHVEIGVEICKKYKENPQIIHAIEAHHGDVEAKTVLAFIVKAADAISAARPGARSESLENYLNRLEKLEEIANSFRGIESSYAVQAGREIRIMVKPQEISDDKMVLVAHDIVKRIENELNYPGQVKVNLIRESRAVDYAN